ncbi:hypothetical protein SAMN05661091_1438 [Paenibacillus uliginis N3/975]|uniref:Uncharacterized protein n=1 Tax=Paenibacillus uliginis N3/975 TaxID=1313296 RepID=A0A1X7H0Y0_9BACL|nr:hypothetical protein [Paenibacillus uliginis]SMF77397.1 hypothetical protein SAMN05661091_1438 [Paenibacillus uliginis N3/975]
MKIKSVPSMTTLQYLALIHQVSYTNVCKDAGITPQQFSDWVKKRRPVPKERLQALGVYFNVEPTLLVDDNLYLKDLSIDMKIKIQIHFINELLENAEEETDMEAYREKLIQLQKEQEQQMIIDKFTAMVKEADTQTLRLCNAFLDQVKSRDLDALLTILNIKEAE